jgi:hypothetical protein
VAASYSGRQGEEAGLGAVSLIFDLLPHIPLQLIFYNRDDEFPARPLAWSLYFPSIQKSLATHPNNAYNVIQ